MAFSELSWIHWLIGIVIGLPILLVIVGFSLTFIGEFNDGIQASNAVMPAQKNMLSGTTSRMNTLWDYAFLSFFIGCAVAVILIARSTTISPVWWYFILFLMAIVGLTAAFMSNFYEQANIDASLGLAVKMPIMHHFASAWLVYVLIIGFAALVFTRSGPGGDF